MNKHIQQIVIVLLLFLTYIFIMPRYGHGGDLTYWKIWCEHIFSYGLINAYGSQANYHPFFMYILWIFNLSQNSIDKIHQNIYLLKAFTLIFDFITAYAVLIIIPKNYRNFQLIPFLLLFNISYLYNTLIWGQVDAIYTCFVFLAFIFMYKKNIILSSIFYTIAINNKMQAIIFLPLLILMFVYFYHCFSKKQIIISVISAIIIQIIIPLPFIFGSGLHKIISVYTSAIDYYTLVSMNAFNIWYFIINGNPFEVWDTLHFLGIRYRDWGILMFIFMSIISLLPMSLMSFNSFLRKKYDDNNFLKVSLLSFALITIVFFYFNTQMHERYSHPVLIFTATYTIISKKYFLYILSSIAYFLNMEKVLQFLELQNYKTLIFNELFISSLFLIFIIVSIIILYKKINLKQELIYLKNNFKNLWI